MGRPRRFRIPLAVAAVLVIHSTIVWYAWRTTSRRAMRDAETAGRQRLSLYASSIERALDKYRPLPEILARDKDILALLHSPYDASLVDSVNRSLEATNAATNASALYVLKPDGVALAASNWNLDLSFVGRSLAYRPYYHQAIATGIGRFFGVGTTSGLPGYFMASSVQSATKRIGVVVVKVDLEPLERDWTRAEERVLVADANGVAFLASRPELKYGLMAPLPRDAAETIAAQHQYPADALHAIHYSIERELAQDARIVRLQTGARNTRFLMQSLTMPSDGWTIHYLSDLAAVDVQARDSAIKAGGGLVAATLLLLYLRQRRLALRATLDSRDKLEAQVHARTVDLRAEIAERQKAEKILREAHDELVHAGKMAALGQMSAAIAHELNQPLTAMQTFLASTRVLLEEGDEEQAAQNLALLEELGQRMSRITGQLRGFSPRRSGRAERVALDLAIERALLLCEGRVRLERVDVDMHVPPGASVLAERTRIEQIVLNLVRNALDAMTKREERRLSIHVTENGKRCIMRVGDTGEGILEEHLPRLFEPFFTTKADSEGLGLGLSVTYGIVRELGGSIRVESTVGVGSTFIVELPRYELDTV
ncbi:ATP-binding protein [Pendulispora rubella]|uniref:histidine kinase n=1 Tax=Pendulispora rubella TaxID=2741070 RepID=A0ABZ2L183_9BACT